MKNKKNTGFYLAAKKFWKTVVHKKNKINTFELQLQIEAHKRLFSIFQPGAYYFLLFDIYQGEIEEISPEITNVLGYWPQELTMRQFMDNIHPVDKSYFLSFEDHTTQFFNHISVEKIGHYKVQYDLRLKKIDQKYAHILIQYVPVHYEEHNIYHTFHIHTDITHLKSEGVPTFSIIGIDGEPSYYNIQPAQTFTKSYDLFTNREREILKLIVEGKTSQQIADHLFISIHTVNCHRKNMLAKAAVKTPLELLNKAIKEGWL